MKTLYIDADACPVRREAVEVATRHTWAVQIVSNGGIRPDPHPLVTITVVPQTPDAADIWIAECIGEADICVTSDIPLAARCLEAGGTAIRPDGDTFTQASIGRQLAMRDLMADLRSANPLGTGGGNAAFTRADRSRFRDRLDALIRKSAR